MQIALDSGVTLKSLNSDILHVWNIAKMDSSPKALISMFLLGTSHVGDVASMWMISAIKIPALLKAKTSIHYK